MKIPARAYTLQILRHMGDHVPMLMLGDENDGYGICWTLQGQQVQPAVARYLMGHDLIAIGGVTELGAKTLHLTEAGRRLRESGIAWWQSLGLIDKLKAILFG